MKRGLAHGKCESARKCYKRHTEQALKSLDPGSPPTAKSIRTLLNFLANLFVKCRKAKRRDETLENIHETNAIFQFPQEITHSAAALSDQDRFWCEPSPPLPLNPSLLCWDYLILFITCSAHIRRPRHFTKNGNNRSAHDCPHDGPLDCPHGQSDLCPYRRAQCHYRR